MVQKLIFNEGSLVGMCSIEGADAQQSTKQDATCRVDDATLMTMAQNFAGFAS